MDDIEVELHMLLLLEGSQQFGAAIASSPDLQLTANPLEVCHTVRADGFHTPCLLVPEKYVPRRNSCILLVPLTEAQLGEAGVTLKAHNIVMLASDLLLQHPAARDARESDWGTLWQSQPLFHHGPGLPSAAAASCCSPPICCCCILLLVPQESTAVASEQHPRLRGSLRSPAAAGETHT